MQPVPTKPIFFDLAFHQIVEDDGLAVPVSPVSGHMKEGLPTSPTQLASSAVEGGIGMVKGLIGSWWGAPANK
jgi:hypothetical protein